jgi:hypothetical protein
MDGFCIYNEYIKDVCCVLNAILLDIFAFAFVLPERNLRVISFWLEYDAKES